MTTITEVASKANVSKATVSRVISGATFVKDETKQRVLKAIKALDYTPNQAARSLASKKSYTVGLVLLNLDSEYYAPVASSIEAVLRQEDLHVIIASGQGTEKGEREAVEFLIRRQVDALVLITSYLSPDALALFNQRCPVFVLNQEYPGSQKKTVLFDNYLGGFMATEYLINKGHTQIGNITGPIQKPDANDRFNGYKDALKKHALQPCCYTEGDFTIQGGIEAMQHLITADNQPTALVCGNDFMAIGAIYTCNQQGISIPDDLAIVGFDDLDIAKYFTPALTTVKVPLFDMSAAIAKLLLQQVFFKNHSVNTLFKPEMVIRQSA